MNQKSPKDLLDYQELLDKLGNSNSNHLLLGNGFNNSLGIKTNYSEIFSQMKKEYPRYGDIEDILKKENFDIEKIIGYLKKQMKSDEKDFLRNYVENKVKLDFMKATNTIAQKNIKKVYRESNQGIHLLLKDFTNYFTLNYDPFLYLLLMKFKKDVDGSGKAVAFQSTFLTLAKDMDQNQNNIYTQITRARESGKLGIYLDGKSSEVNLKNTKKKQFETIIKTYSEKNNLDWKTKDIKEVCDKIWKDESNQSELDVNDGFQSDLFNGEKQNLYFLHGAFQIVTKGSGIRKITAKQNKSFCEELEKAINEKDEDIVLVLTDTSEEKKEQINQNRYLRKCFESLSKIDGSLVILGSSLAENDQHIFDQINNSSINHIYVSSCEKSKERDFERVNTLFETKNTTLFDYETISYNNGQS